MFLLVLIAVVIGSLIAKFLREGESQNEVYISKARVENKYSELIRIISANSNPTVFQSDTDTYLFGWLTPNADNRFKIIQIVNYAYIEWHFKGRIAFLNKTITLTKKWKFSDDTNQGFMAKKVLEEMKEKFERSEFGGF